MKSYKLYMTEHEICMAYLYAKNRKEQVDILCDLNVSCLEAILIVLDYHGYDISKYWSDETLRMGKEELDRIILDELKKGLKCKKIANKLGYSYGYIVNRAADLRKRGLFDGTIDTQNSSEPDNIDNEQSDKFKYPSIIEHCDKNTQLLYYDTYKRIENILKLRLDTDSDEVKQAFSELAIKILRSTIEEG